MRTAEQTMTAEEERDVDILLQLLDIVDPVPPPST